MGCCTFLKMENSKKYQVRRWRQTLWCIHLNVPDERISIYAHWKNYLRNKHKTRRGILDRNAHGDECSRGKVHCQVQDYSRYFRWFGEGISQNGRVLHKTTSARNRKKKIFAHTAFSWNLDACQFVQTFQWDKYSKARAFNIWKAIDHRDNKLSIRDKSSSDDFHKFQCSN